jgi:hypothetical protein
MAYPRYNEYNQPTWRSTIVTAITTNTSGQANVTMNIRRVRSAMANYAPYAAATSGWVRVKVTGFSGPTVTVQAMGESGSPIFCASGYVLSGGNLTVWADGDQ